MLESSTIWGWEVIKKNKIKIQQPPLGENINTYIHFPIGMAHSDLLKPGEQGHAIIQKRGISPIII